MMKKQEVGINTFIMCCLAITYLIGLIGYWINRTFFDGGFHIQNPPFIAYFVHCFSIMLLLWGVYLLTKKQRIAWYCINIGAISIILCSFSYYICFRNCFYFSVLHFPILSFMFIYFIIKFNSMIMKKKYKIYLNWISYLKCICTSIIILCFMYLTLKEMCVWLTKR